MEDIGRQRQNDIYWLDEAKRDLSISFSKAAFAGLMKQSEVYQLVAFTG